MDPDPEGPKTYGSGSGTLVLNLSLRLLVVEVPVLKEKLGT
jgi:hypothetical protein